MTRATTATRVLIVEDDDDIAFILSHALRDHEVVVAEHGTSARDRLAAERFDVVLCDVLLPDVDGLALHDAVDAEQARRFVFITGGAPDNETWARLDALPNRVVTKPILPREVRELVATLLAEEAPV